MGLFNFFKKDNNSNKQKKHRGNKIAVYTNSIPSDVKDLLFISDKPTVWNKTQNGPISFELSSDFEPSEITTSLPVRQGNEIPLGYYPSYSEMSPEQRFKYLSFLTDITNPIDIGYVFVFYYGLERNIYMNRKFAESIDMIVKLQHYHTNKSFLSYSNDALIFAAMKTKDPSILYKINLNYLKPELLFLVKGSFIGSFSPEDLMVMAKAVGFSNQRYIKSDPELFSNNLKKLLQKKYGRDEYILDKAIKIDTKELIRLMLANTSIPEREFQYPNLILSSKIHSDFYLLIKEAHEKTKVELAELRKKKPNKHPKKEAKDTKKKDEIYTPNDGLSLKERILLSKEAISDGFDEEMRGIELYKEGNLKDAEEWLLRSVKANFDAPALYEKLGILYRKQKRFSDEVEILKIGIKNAGNIPKLTERLAKAIELNEKDKLENKMK
ncbi:MULTISPECIES: TerB N-terminal domain-containing protein [Enterococcus]|uniref:TerB N-terminal domain-containing protein n=1 Tax=Candidatus Enterococcus murrayae TaxID=2815321 RepID=A0ABS3HD39_9ENTE|nr:TerB N-terminal domain-containing protein [Enterococcus sp. MJM16]MBO0451370.1 TerB N-terminal domain-containing protein [Enterococcus sp. MJM16]